MPYLNCPDCRLTVYRPVLEAGATCPRCSGALGKASPLFAKLPARFRARRGRAKA